MSRRYGQTFLAAIFLILAVTGGRAASGNSAMKLKDVALGKVVQVGNAKFVKVRDNQYLALNLCPDGSTYSSFYKGCVVKTTTFDYTGGEQTFTVSADGYYVLEVWGAQGAISYNGTGGYGGYALGIIKENRSENLYVYVGGKPYNGGGGGSGGANGGGATHIATTSRGALANYKNYQTDVIIVAGGGGGNERPGRGGSGGGMKGAQGMSSSYYIAGAGTQESGGQSVTSSCTTIDGTFGLGGRATSSSGDMGGSGGGGWYGGGGTCVAGAGGGGSGYIGNSVLLSLTDFPKHMTCYECLESSESATLTFTNTCVDETPIADCAKIGYGAARITQLSVYLGI